MQRGGGVAALNVPSDILKKGEFYEIREKSGRLRVCQLVSLPKMDVVLKCVVQWYPKKTEGMLVLPRQVVLGEVEEIKYHDVDFETKVFVLNEGDYYLWSVMSLSQPPDAAQRILPLPAYVCSSDDNSPILPVNTLPPNLEVLRLWQAYYKPKLNARRKSTLNNL